MKRLLITCDTPPVPPLDGHIRKTHDLVEALRAETEIHLLVYAEGGAIEAVREYWDGRSVKVHPLQRRTIARHLRSLASSLSLPTVTRDFAAEAALVAQLGSAPGTRLLVDFLSGAPLCRRFRRGVVQSGHDCLSLLFGEEARSAKSLSLRWHLRIREHFARTAERRFAHLPERYHVVSDKDARELERINPGVRPVVIPLGGPAPDPLQLRPADQRAENVIWGNLDSAVIADGFRAVLDEVQHRKPELLRGWKIYGRIPADVAHQRFPQIRSLGLEYADRIPVVGAVLGNSRRLLLPDVSGAGQKNRTLDGLAHGCCVFGLEEVFRGIGSGGREPFVRCDSVADLVKRLAAITDAQADAIGLQAAQHFLGEFSLPALAKRWRALFASIGPLEVGAGERSG